MPIAMNPPLSLEMKQLEATGTPTTSPAGSLNNSLGKSNSAGCATVAAVTEEKKGADGAGDCNAPPKDFGSCKTAKMPAVSADSGPCNVAGQPGKTTDGEPCIPIDQVATPAFLPVG